MYGTLNHPGKKKFGLVLPTNIGLLLDGLCLFAIFVIFLYLNFLGFMGRCLFKEFARRGSVAVTHDTWHVTEDTWNVVLFFLCIFLIAYSPVGKILFSSLFFWPYLLYILIFVLQSAKIKRFSVSGMHFSFL